MLFLVLKVLSQLFYMPSMIYFLKFTVKVFTINIVFTVSFFFLISWTQYKTWKDQHMLQTF